jgi:hypothetical protein
MTLQYSNYNNKKSHKKKRDIPQFKQIEITIRKNGIIRIELIPLTTS